MLIKKTLFFAKTWGTVLWKGAGGMVFGECSSPLPGIPMWEGSQCIVKHRFWVGSSFWARSSMPLDWWSPSYFFTFNNDCMATCESQWITMLLWGAGFLSWRCRRDWCIAANSAWVDDTRSETRTACCVFPSTLSWMEAEAHLPVSRSTNPST